MEKKFRTGIMYRVYQQRDEYLYKLSHKISLPVPESCLSCPVHQRNVYIQNNFLINK